MNQHKHRYLVPSVHSKGCLYTKKSHFRLINMCLLNIYYVLDTVLGMENRIVFY